MFIGLKKLAYLNWLPLVYALHLKLSYYIRDKMLKMLHQAI